MADIKRIWITKTSRYNDKLKQIEYYYTCDIQVEGKNGISMEIDVPEEMINAVYKVISPSIKKNLTSNLEDLKDEL